MAGQGQFKRAIASRWTSVNPILAAGELGLETDTLKMKFGNGTDHWSALSYANIGNTGPTGPQGATGTGLSRITASTINFGVEDTYIETTINDINIQATSAIQVVITDADFILQGVTAGVLSISTGVNYTIWAIAPNGATGDCSVNILIYQ
jgi:hypothetical protein